MTTSDSLSLSRELTAREIFNRIVKGGVVRIPNDPGLAKQLYNHLNVIKSREKRIFADLGLDFISSVISIKPFCLPANLSQETCNKFWNAKPGEIIPLKAEETLDNNTVQGFEVKLIAPKKRRKYTTFSIQQNEPSPSSI